MIANAINGTEPAEKMETGAFLALIGAKPRNRGA